MLINDLLRKSDYQYPFSYSGFYNLRIQDLLTLYFSDIYDVTDPDIDDTLRAEIKEISETIINIIRLYTFGHAYDAHFELFNLMDKLKPVFTGEIFTSIFKPNFNGLYKVRNVELSANLLSCKDNYIIDQDLYNLIGTNRFSIPGYPCLYLGTSSYVCSLEIPIQKGKTQIITRYEQWDSVLDNALYLHYLPNDIVRIINSPKFIGDRKQILSSYLKVLPFLLTIYHKVQREEGPYRPEYILSQMMTQWTRKNGISSICYLSTKVDYTSIEKRLCLNYAFPSQTPDITYENVAEFQHKFYLSKTMHYDNAILENLYIINKQRLVFSDNYGREVSKPNILLFGVDYWDTIHGKIDRLLQNSPNYGFHDKDFNQKKDINVYEYAQKAKQF